MLFQMRKVKVPLSTAWKAKKEKRKNAKERENGANMKMATFESPIYSLRAQDISFKLAIKSSFCFGL